MKRPPLPCSEHGERRKLYSSDWRGKEDTRRDEHRTERTWVKMSPVPLTSHTPPHLPLPACATGGLRWMALLVLGALLADGRTEVAHPADTGPCWCGLVSWGLSACWGVPNCWPPARQVSAGRAQAHHSQAGHSTMGGCLVVTLGLIVGSLGRPERSSLQCERGEYLASWRASAVGFDGLRGPALPAPHQHADPVLANCCSGVTAALFCCGRCL